MPHTSTARVVHKVRIIKECDIVWPESDGLASLAKCAAASHLLLHPERNSSSRVAEAVRAKLGTSTKALGLPSFRQLLLQDPVFSVTDATASEAHIHLDVSKLHTAANNKVSQAIKLLFAQTASLGASTASKVLRAVALLLLEQPGYRARCSWVAAAIDQSLGSMAKLGISSPFRQLLDSHTCFKLTPAPVKGDMYVKLDVKQLMQQAQQTAEDHSAVALGTAELPPSPPAPPPPPPPSPSTATTFTPATAAAAAAPAIIAINAEPQQQLKPEADV